MVDPIVVLKELPFPPNSAASGIHQFIRVSGQSRENDLPFCEGKRRGEDVVGNRDSRQQVGLHQIMRSIQVKAAEVRDRQEPGAGQRKVSDVVREIRNESEHDQGIADIPTVSEVQDSPGAWPAHTP